MPQLNPFPVAKTPSNVAAQLNLDGSGNLKVAQQGAVTVTGTVSNSGSATNATYNITSATAVKASAGRLVRISVIVAGSAAGTANDCATTGAAAASNQIAAIPATAGPMQPLDWPCATGIVIVPGTGQTIAVSYV